MRAVYKYPLSNAETQLVSMPRGAKIVHVGMQDDTITLWAEVGADTLEDLERRRFDVYGTGHVILKNDAFHIGTVFQEPKVEFMFSKPFVWHVYEVPVA